MIYLLLLLTGCIVSPGPVVVSTPTPTPTSAPVISAPLAVFADTPFQVSFEAKEEDVVQIYADKKFFISPMLWDPRNSVKYMTIKLHDRGPRTLDFKVNGKFAASTSIVVH